MKKLLLLFISSCAIFFHASYAQVCILDGGGEDGIGYQRDIIMGQTFVACQSGVITSLAIRVNTGALGTLGFWIGPSSSPPSNALSAGVRLQEFNITQLGIQYINVDLHVPFFVTEGNIYAFEFESQEETFGVTNFWYLNQNGYSGGNVYEITGGGIVNAPAYDLDFNLTIEQPPVTMSTPAHLENEGFSKFGSDAPAIKMKKLVGRTGAFGSGYTLIAHGLSDPKKILGVHVIVNDQHAAHPDQIVRILPNFISVETPFLDMPIKVLVTYEE